MNSNPSLARRLPTPVDDLDDAALAAELVQHGIEPPPDLLAVQQWLLKTFPKGDVELKLFDIGHNVPVASFSATRRHGIKVSSIDASLARSAMKAAVQQARLKS